MNSIPMRSLLPHRITASLLVLLPLMCAPDAWTGETVLIKRVLENPGSYHLTMVTFAGTVSEVTALAPYYIPTGTACYGAYTFTLRDASGSLSVAVLGICGVPADRPQTIADGDQVIVHTHIRAPGKSSYVKGQTTAPMPMIDRDALVAIATTIVPSANAHHRDE